MLTLVLGGVRSGKSAFAETLARKAENTGRHIVYIATGSPLDAEMASRIAHHRARRPAGWITVEEPIALAKTLAEWARRDRYLLVDCLTLWLSNLILADTPSGAPKSGAILGEERMNLIKTLPDLEGEIVLVSNEVGMGLVSPDPLGRLFVDESGRLHQEVAALANNVYWVVAGHPIHVKGHEIGVDGT
jgi:adenosylcobinamide kinase / adenosylcobinamide-phosphate guanylyltransferase